MSPLRDANLTEHPLHGAGGAAARARNLARGAREHCKPVGTPPASPVPVERLPTSEIVRCVGRITELSSQLQATRQQQVDPTDLCSLTLGARVGEGGRPGACVRGRGGSPPTWSALCRLQATTRDSIGKIMAFLSQVACGT